MTKRGTPAAAASISRINLLPPLRFAAGRKGPSAAANHIGQPSTEELLKAMEDMSWKINDLARELGCLGHFDNNDDRPKAA